MTRIVYHSGGCCGRRCVSNFGGLDTEQRANTWLKQALSRLKGRGKVTGFIVEVVLTDNQLNAKKWRKPLLEKHGFRLVMRGKNRNGGNMLNVFLHHPFEAHFK